MADISNPNEPATKNESSVNRQRASEENCGNQETGGVGEAKVPPRPNTNNETTDNPHDPYEGWRTIVAIVALIVSLCSLAVSIFSVKAANKSAAAAEKNATTAKETFETVQRASVNLGLPEGKIAEIVPGPTSQLIVLYFRNYGTVTAQNTIIEFWPITLFPDMPHSTVHIPPPQKVESFGPAYPPGLPFPISKKYTESSLDALETGEKALSIIGRVRYADQHREYCESFLLIYIRKPMSKFVLMSSGNPMEPLDFCTGREFSMQLGEPPVPIHPNTQQENKK